MQFTGQVTEVKPISGTTTRGQKYQGVELTVVETVPSKDIYANACVVYVKDATPEQFPIGVSVMVEPRVDIKKSTDGTRKYNTVVCHYITPETL